VSITILHSSSIDSSVLIDCHSIGCFVLFVVGSLWNISWGHWFVIFLMSCYWSS